MVGHRVPYSGSQGFRWLICIIVWLVWGAVVGPPFRGEERQDPVAATHAADDPNAPWNLESPTLGGKQFWTDERVFHDWRIQRLVVSGHYRLLDDRNVRQAWGTREQCEAVFLRLKQEKQLPPLGREVVILLHGLTRTRESMEPIAKYLREHSRYTVLTVGYASSREKTADHAAALAKVIEHLDGVEQVHFVAHSLGNLVIRHYLADRDQGVHQGKSVPQIGRIVMLAPPNQGAEIARRVRASSLFRTVWGTTGQEIARHWEELEPRLAVPRGEFGIIAGSLGNSDGRNPLVAGDDDMVVAVSETRLVGAADFLELPVLHSFIMTDDRVLECTLRFLEHGYFVTPKAREPITSLEPAP